MGSKLKSLGLSGARKAGSKAMRRLFGRESPAVNGGSCDSDALVTSTTKEKQQQASSISPDTLNDGANDPTSTTVTHPRPEVGTNSNSLSPNPVKDVQTNETTEDMAMRPLQPSNQQRPLQPLKPNDVADPKLAAAPLGKENQAPSTAALQHPTTVEEITKEIKDLALIGDSQLLATDTSPEFEVEPEVDEKTKAEQAKHLFFMEEALEMARLALRTNETPVGCVLVHKDRVIARGMNATNVTRNGTRHAEFMALSALISVSPKTGPRTTSLRPKIEYPPQNEADDNASTVSPQPDEGNEDGKKGHLYPYGQKEISDEVVHPDIVRECTLYVTVEPCIMCASLLRQMGIRKVYFGAVNDKFGGTGGVFSIHANSLPVSDDGQTASAHPQTAPMRLPGGGPILGTSFPLSGGDGGNVEPGFEIEGGWGRDDAVGLLRRFYVQENERAPIPRKKEGRAARLAAMMQEDSASDVGESTTTKTNPDVDETTNPSASEAGDARQLASEDDDSLNSRTDDEDDESTIVR